MTGKACGCSSETCGCCQGVETLTPLATANRPGLDGLRYRIGDHGAFLETMKARLATTEYAVPDIDGQTPKTVRPLTGLTNRDSGDAAIAILDGWATVADVLTFYQERIANEAYLRTATERRSILELAKLIGYRLRPGVASSVFLAYTVDEHQKDSVEIGAGARSQSIPGPGELPQYFETSENLLVRAEWSNLKPRVTQPQVIDIYDGSSINTDTLYFQGTGTALKPNDPLVVDFASTQLVLHVKTVETDFTNNRTKVILQEGPQTQSTSRSASELPARSVKMGAAPNPFDALVEPLSIKPLRPYPASAFLPRDLNKAFGATSDTLPQLVTTFNPAIISTIYPAWSGVSVVATQPAKIYALRAKAAPFGSNAPLRTVTDDRGRVIRQEEWPLAGLVTFGLHFHLAPPPIILLAADGPALLTVEFAVTEGTDKATVQQDVTSGDKVKLSDDWDVLVTFEQERWAAFSFSNKEGTNRTVTFTLDDQPTITLLKIAIDQDVQTLTTGQTIHFYHDLDSISAGYDTDFNVNFSQIAAASLDPRILDLDTQVDQIVPDTWTVIVRSDRTRNPNIENPLICKVDATQTISKAAYGISGKSTELKLRSNWLGGGDLNLSAVRETTVYAQAEALPLSDMPYQPDAEGLPADIGGNVIELQQLYDGLQSGRWIIISGERSDIKSEDQKVEGVRASELAMIAAVTQAADPDMPGDKVHTTLHLANNLAYRYKRETATIFSNVVKATHGETRNETLGAGDSSKALQSFTLKQPPLTFVPAPTPQGVESTLKVYVNDVEWKEMDSLAGLGPKDRNFIAETDNEGKTTVIFGNGQQASRLPTGIENVKAVYRNGIGKPGNVRANQISLLQTRPLGVKEVINPLPASGGADKESRDQARGNAPLAVQALDRLVSVQDYADFTRTFAGIGKAVARRLSDGRNHLVHITIAGADDIPIDKSSDLYRNLLTALRQFGDRALRIQVDTRELLVLVLTANIRLAPGYLWEPVSTAIRALLLEGFGFQKRALGQPALLCEIIRLIQGVEGVAYVDVDAFNGIPEKRANSDGTRSLLTLNEMSLAARGARPASRSHGQYSPDLHIVSPNPYVAVNVADFDNGRLRPAQIALFTSSVPDTIVLNQIT